MRWLPALVPLVLAASTLSSGCVQVRKSSSRPARAWVSRPDGPGAMGAEATLLTPVAYASVARVRSTSYFDLASCFPPPPLVTGIFSDEQLLGTLISTRPAVLECLVAPAHRGRRDRTLATVSVVARAGAGVEATVSGENLTPGGELCVLQAVRPALSALPSLPQGWPPAAAQAEFVHDLDTLPAVTTGDGPLSDAAGKIRLAMPSFCPCFEPWRDAPPRELEGNVILQVPDRGMLGSGRVQKEVLAVNPWKVTFPGELGSRDQEVASCLRDRVMAMQFAPPRLEVDIPVYFKFIDSRRDGMLPDLPVWLQHKQLEAVRNRRFAEMLLALGARSSAARAYDALVQRYQENRRAVKFDALSHSCAGLLKTDEAWTGAVERKLEVERLALATAHELGNDESREAVLRQIAETERSLASAAEVRLADERACPRRVYGAARRKGHQEQVQVTPFRP